MLISMLRIALPEVKLISVSVLVCIQASEVRVNFVVMRSAETQEEGGSSGGDGPQGRPARRAPEPQYFRRRSTYMKVGTEHNHSVHSDTNTNTGIRYWADNRLRHGIREFPQY